MACTFNTSCLTLSCIFLLQFSSVTCTAKVPAIVVFGDSTVDPGNNNYIPCLLKSDFPPYGRDLPGGKPTGRFSNGLIPPDVLARALGLGPDAMVPAYLDPTKGMSDFAVAFSFASAGTGYDNATAAILNVIPLWKEVEYYKEYQKRLISHLGVKKARHIIREALYVVSIGTNDFLINYDIFPTRRSHFTLDQYEDFLLGIAESFIRELYALGARKFSYTGLAAIGCVPMERTFNFLKGRECREEYNLVAKRFNVKLGKLLDSLNIELLGIKMVMTNSYGPLEDILSNPEKYGFEVTDKGCCGTGLVELGFICNKDSPFTCEDANKYVFWDSFHPSDKTNRIITEHLAIDSINQFF